MIYLFDDKEARQRSYGWDDNLFKEWEQIICPIRTYSDYLRIQGDSIFTSQNIILYHESFVNCVPLESRSDFIYFHDSVLAQQNDSETPIAVFSGSLSSRQSDSLTASLPVSDLYNNLEVFLKHVQDNDVDFKYLLWGEDYAIENILLNKFEEVDETEDEDYDDADNWDNVFFAYAQKYRISQPSESCTTGTLWLSRVSDEDLDRYINDWFFEKEYEAIYIPLCFGKTLSDYNGLRLALHIRCTPQINQNKPIIIYGPVTERFLLKSVYFDILKTKGVKLIGMSQRSLHASSNFGLVLSDNELRNEMEKVRLPIPQNYEDGHSIANEWGIYRWAVATESFDSDIQKIFSNVNSNLFFKHLRTVYPPSNAPILKEQELLFSDNLSTIPECVFPDPDINVLYVDDDADKGWYEIMASIFSDVNKIVDFNYLGKELRSFSEDDIVNTVVNKVLDSSVNILLLDFRLHKHDHEQDNIEHITSVRILKEIKRVNPGIQVIVFSATNKVWNLLALQQFGADGFIIKEGPENSSDKQFTKSSITNFVQIVSQSISNRYKKNLWQNIEQVKLILDRRTKKHMLNRGFTKAVKLFLDMAYSSLPTNVKSNNFDHSFINFFRIIEAVANELIDVENPIVDENIMTGEKLYSYQFRGTDEFLLDYNEEEYSEFAQKLSLRKRSLPFVQKFYNLFNRIGLLTSSTYGLVQKRNAITHPNLKVNDNIDPISLEDVLISADIAFKCIYNMRREE